MGFSLSDLDFISPVVGKGGIIDEGLRTIDDKVLGGDAEDAALEAGEIQAQAAQQAGELFNPFQVIGQQGLNQAGFLTDPNQQFDFLQSNPLFQLGLDNLNTQSNRQSRATGRLGATDANQQLINNALLAASPLINQQKQSIGNLLDFGLTTADRQGNLITGGAAAQAGGIVGGANARQAGLSNLFNLGGLAAGAFAPTPGVPGATPAAPTRKTNLIGID